MAKCESCGLEMVVGTATEAKPYQYTLSGLKNVFLAGIKVRECASCKEQCPIIPKIGDLHRLIADWLLEKPTRLNGPELRFLRKNAGFPGNQFAALLGVSASHLSRAEHGHSALGLSTDRLARLIVATASEGERPREALLELASKLAKRSKMAIKRPTFKLEQNRWLAAA
jgi:transcriptional regulator with XRE-family HTH domain